MPSKGYNSRAYVSNAPGAFYQILQSDFGQPAPGVSALASQATGSIQTTTADLFVKTTFITAEGETTASAEATIALSSATAYGVKVTQPTVPTNGQTIIGWRIYSAYATNTELLNTAVDTTNFTTTRGTIAGIAISSNSSAQTTILVVGSGASAPVYNLSGLQQPLPAIAANTGVDYYAIVPNSGSQWKQQKSVDWMNPDGILETLGIVLNHLNFVQPVYPGAANPPQGGANPPSSTYTQVSVGNGAYMVMNGNLFVAVQATSASTATTFVGGAAFNVSRGTTVTDGSVSWLALGKAGLLRFDFDNVTSGTLTPAAREYDVFQQ